MSGLAPLMNVLFRERRDFHVSCGQGYVREHFNRPTGSSMVDMGISSNIVKFPFPKCYMAFWDMTLYSDTHYFTFH